MVEGTSVSKQMEVNIDIFEEKWPSFDPCRDEERNRGQYPTQKRAIDFTPPVLRENENIKHCFEPKYVAIGPLHHGKSKLEAGQNVKLTMAKEFIKRRSVADHQEIFFGIFNHIIKNIENLKQHYNPERLKKYSDEELAWMFLVDGCAVLHFIACWPRFNSRDSNFSNQIITFIQEDLCLFENQLPMELFEYLEGDFAFWVPKAVFSLGFLSGEDELLEPILAEFEEHEDKVRKDGAHCMFKERLRETMKRKRHITLLEVTWDTMLSVRRDVKSDDEKKINTTGDKSVHFYSFRSVSELKAAGIFLIPIDSGSDVSFRSLPLLGGVLSLPRISLDRSDIRVEMNFVAYEFNQSSDNDFYVSNTICFYNSLISNVEDVKEMISAGVLLNSLGSEEDVVKYYREVAAVFPPNFGGHDSARRAINEYFKRSTRVKVANWWYEMRQNYCRSPWTVIAVFASSLVIILTSIQTYFAAFPRS